jgi:hypothetical protein
MYVPVSPHTDTIIERDILLPSNKVWRMKNYYKLVEQQRALDASL